MPIPSANYTRETFADYLEFEVLYETARDLTWTSYSPYYNPLLTADPPINTGLTNPIQGDSVIWIAAVATSATQTISPVPYAVPSGTKINFSGTIRTLASDYPAMGNTMVFTASFTSALGDKGVFANPLANVRVQHEQLDAIIDETLIRLGIDDITTLSSVEQLRKLRLYGRRECWLAVMQATTGYYDYATVEVTVQRNDIYTSARLNFEIEDRRIKDFYNEGVATVDITGLANTSGRHKVVARW